MLLFGFLHNTHDLHQLKKALPRLRENVAMNMNYTM